MPVNTHHPAYAELRPRIELTEDAIAGDVRKTTYVAYLTNQSKQAWDAYVNRPAYYNVTDRTLLALVGALVRKPYTIEGLVDEIPNTVYSTFDEALQRCYRTILSQGRVGLHVDFDEVIGKPKLIVYESEHIINWGAGYYVIKECVPVKDPDDPFAHKTVDQYRELRLDEAGLYEVRLWREDGGKKFKVVETLTPTIRGERLNFIPLWISTPYDNSDELYNPPLSALAELNIRHFKVSVDHSHGLHFLALPTPWIAGELYSADPNLLPKQVQIGGETFIQMVTGSSIGFLEFSGNGLGALKEELLHLEDQMHSAGSRLLTSKQGVESAEALRLRSGSESAVLVTIAQSLEVALRQALAVYNQWAGSTTEPTVELNTDFTATVIDPAELKVLLEAFTSGAITLETLLQRLYDGEIVSDPIAEAAALRGSGATNTAQPT